MRTRREFKTIFVGGIMKQYQKIDVYFNGDYVCSTTQSKTCKAAIASLLDSATRQKHSIAGSSLTNDRFLKHPKLLKARYSK